MASTFWKKTIPLFTGWDQLTRARSSWCSVKLPAVWKNFFGTIGARRRTSPRGTTRPVSPTAPSRAKYSTVDRQSSSTTWSSTSRPTCPWSKVTSFMRHRFLSVKVSFQITGGSDRLSRCSGDLVGPADVEEPELQRQRRVVANESGELEDVSFPKSAHELLERGVVS